MPGFHSASEYTKLSFLLVLGTSVVHIISFGSPYWSSRFDGHAGLWAGCSNGLCYDRAQLWIAQWIKVCQAFMSMAMVVLVACSTLLFFYTYTIEFCNDKRLVFLAAIGAVAAAFFTFITVCTWAGKEYFGGREALNWGYAFAILSCLLSIVIGALLIMELKEPEVAVEEKPRTVDASVMFQNQSFLQDIPMKEYPQRQY